jgi:phosphoadenosine phosphosulfate reductase
MIVSELQQATSKADVAREVISRALEASSNVCLTCSFQADDMVSLHLLRERLPNVPVLFLETGYHFADVYSYRDEMTAKYNLNLVNVMPERTVAEQESEFPVLYRTAPDQCCKLRKVGPLFQALEQYSVWFTGLRRVQSPTRANLQPVDNFPLPSGKQIVKVSPLFDWTDKEVWNFARSHEIPLVSLYDRGYTSIGCEPCTALPDDPSNPRSGRWAGQKLECGIHIAEGN